MNHRHFPALDRDVSEVGLGCWQLDGGSFGPVSADDAAAILRAALDAGVTFFDTADVYGDGESERRVGLALKGEDVTIATKLGRRGDKDHLTPEQVVEFTDRSLRNLSVETVDLTQLHCVGTHLLRDGAVFDALRDLRAAGKVRAFGASVETIEEGDLCIAGGCASLQVICSALRQRPAEAGGLFDRAAAAGVAVIVRLPLASGLLAGKFTKASAFTDADHRSYNCDGAAFNVGETFAGLPFEVGVDAAEAMRRPLESCGGTMAQGALRWLLDHDAVTSVIAGCTRPEQARDNAAASGLPPLSPDAHAEVRDAYEHHAEPNIRGPY